MICKDTIIGLDFDGTVVTHDFPRVGKDLPFCVDTLKKIVAAGGKLVLWTMRSNTIDTPKLNDCTLIPCDAGNYLDDAVNWFKQRDIPLWGIQRNPDQDNWTSSPKAYAHIYIDDAALGAPTVERPDVHDKPFICWATVDAMLFPEDQY